LVAPIAEGGFGAGDVTLHGASGGVGKDIQINDLVLYSDIYWAGKKDATLPSNDVNREKLAALLPSGVQAHSLPIYDIATVLNGSLDMMRDVENKGGGAIELELAHAARETAKHPGINLELL